MTEEKKDITKKNVAIMRGGDTIAREHFIDESRRIRGGRSKSSRLKIKEGSRK